MKCVFAMMPLKLAAFGVSLALILLLRGNNRNFKAFYRMSHKHCLSYRIPEGPLRHYEWYVYNNNTYVLHNDSAYVLPDYVDCPNAPRTLARQTNRRFVSKRMLQILETRFVNEFYELNPTVIEHACYVNSNHKKSSNPFSHDVCIVIRFYSEQLNNKFGHSLQDCIVSLTEQSHRKTDIIVVNTDSLGDDFGHNVSKTLKTFTSKMHFMSFNDLVHTRRIDGSVDHRPIWLSTEKAIASCPDTARWLLVTNGDNTYHKSFMSYLDDRFDMIAFDFYTRHRPVWSRGQCDAYGRHEGLDLGCLPNNLRLCETDLGSVVFNLHRWRHEKRRFSLHESENGSEDGLLIESLVLDGWSYKRVSGAETGVCLFDHNPNYHSCLQKSTTTVWDDAGHVCLNNGSVNDAAKIKLRQRGAAVRCVW